MSLAEDFSIHAVDDDETREPFGAFVCDDVTHGAALALADRRGWSKGEVQRGGLAAALRQLGVIASPELMLVDISDVEDVEQALEGLGELAADAKVIALGVQNDVGMYRQALDAGAADYLVKPVEADALEAAVDRAERRVLGTAGAAPAKLGRCLGVIGVRGGVGASTVAGNLAWLLAEERQRKLCLVDLDLQFGTLSLGFDVEPGAGLREALEDPERVDDFFMDRAAVKVTERLAVLAAEEPVDDAPRPAPQALAQLCGTLRERYDMLVVDLPRGMLAAQPDVISQITDLVVVTDLSLAGLRDANRLLRFVKAQSDKPKLRVVANRVGKGAQAQLTAAEFGRELDGTLSQQLSLDVEGLSEAAVAGKPLAEAAKRSRLLSDLRTLATEVAGKPRRKRGGLRSLLGGRGRKG